MHAVFIAAFFVAAVVGHQHWCNVVCYVYAYAYYVYGTYIRPEHQIVSYTLWNRDREY